MQLHEIVSQGDSVGPVTVAEFVRMCESGAFADDARVELLDGFVIRMPRATPPHAYATAALTRLFVLRFDGRAWVSANNNVELNARSMPEPDVQLDALPSSRYMRVRPAPPETLLVVEVSRSTLSFDLGRKKRAYARAGIREYWVVDLIHDRVEVFREPRGGEYTVHATVGRGERVAPQAFPNDAFAVEEFLPEPTR